MKYYYSIDGCTEDYLVISSKYLNEGFAKISFLPMNADSE